MPSCGVCPSVCPSRSWTPTVVDDHWLVECEQQLRLSAVQFIAHTATHQWILFITTSMDDHDEEKRTDQNLFICSYKSETKVTNNSRSHSTYCTVEANYWQTWSIAQPLGDSRATRMFIGLELHDWLLSWSKYEYLYLICCDWLVSCG